MEHKGLVNISMAREILRCAQNDSTADCHSERSEESPAPGCPARLAQVICRTDRESPDKEGLFPTQIRSMMHDVTQYSAIDGCGKILGAEA